MGYDEAIEAGREAVAQKTAKRAEVKRESEALTAYAVRCLDELEQLFEALVRAGLTEIEARRLSRYPFYVKMAEPPRSLFRFSMKPLLPVGLRLEEVGRNKKWAPFLITLEVIGGKRTASVWGLTENELGEAHYARMRMPEFWDAYLNEVRERLGRVVENLTRIRGQEAQRRRS